MKIGSLCVLLVFSSILYCSSQTIKTYSGPYANGTATYQYYENSNYERIYNGSFHYTAKISYEKIFDACSICGVEVTGNYKENKKDGDWVFKLNHENYSEIVTGSFDKGFFNGKWTTTKISNANQKVICSSSANYSYGKVIGPLNRQCNGSEFEFSNFDKSGKRDSIWFNTELKSNNEKLEEIRKYKHGVLYWELYRNVSTGEIFRKFDSTNFVSTFFSNYDSLSHVSIVNDKKYILFEKSKYAQPNYYFVDFEQDLYHLNKADTFIYTAKFSTENEIILYEDSPMFDSIEIANKTIQKNYSDSVFLASKIVKKRIADSIQIAVVKRLKFVADSLTKEMEEKIAEKKKEYDAFVLLGDSFMFASKYDSALKNYFDAQKLQNDSSLSFKIKIAEDKKLISDFLLQRNQTYYDLKEINPVEYDSLNSQIYYAIENEMKQSKLLFINISGNLRIQIDTSLKYYFIETELQSENKKFLKSVEDKIQEIRIPVQSKFGYKINVEANFKISSSCYVGKTTFTILTFDNASYSKEPSQQVMDAVANKYLATRNTKCSPFGKYIVKYKVISSLHSSADLQTILFVKSDY